MGTIMDDVKNLFQKPSEFSGDLNYTFDEAMQVLGFDFPIEKWAQKAVNPNKDSNVSSLPVETHMSVVRTDTEQVIGNVGRDYGLVSYADAFSLIEPLIQNNQVEIINGRLIGNGQRAYLFLKAPYHINMGTGYIKTSLWTRDRKLDNDNILCCFSLRSSHDAQAPIEICMVPYRKVNHTALPVGDTIRFKHSKHVKAKLERAEKVIEHIKTTWSEFEDDVKKMASIQLKDNNAKVFISMVLGDNDNSRAANIRDRIFNIYKTGIASKFPSTQNTLFGVVQAIAQWADSEKVVRTAKYLDENSARIEARFSGDAYKKKKQAYDLAVECIPNMSTILTFADSGLGSDA